MKIYINTITPEIVAAINDSELKSGAKESELTRATTVINKTTFIPGEWVHVADDFEVDEKLFPYIKEAHIVLEERTAQALKEKGLDAFAQGLEEAAELYKQDVPAMATTVRMLAAVKMAGEIEE